MALVLPIGLVSCRKDDPSEDDDHDDHDHVHSSMALHMNHKFGSETFQLNDTYTLDDGSKVKISRAEFYLSQPHITTMEDVQVDNYSDEYVLIQAGTMHYELGDADFTQDHFHKLVFNVGVDSVANHSDPTTYDASHALSLKTPSMHWAWSSGYRFMVIEGSVDTDDDGTFENDFAYHIGMDDFLVSDTLHMHKNITSAGLMIMLNVDYKELFTGLDLTTDLSTHTMDNMPLANKVKANFSEFITYEE